jgi:hypothetical protein
MRRAKAEFVRHFVLQRFDVGRKELDHAPARSTYHVVVVLVVVMMLVIRFAVAEADLACEAGLGQQFESSINRSKPDGVVLLVNQMVKVLACEVFLGAEEDLQDQIALICAAKPRSLDVLFENSLFGREVFVFRAQFTVLSTRFYHFSFDFATATFVRSVSIRAGLTPCLAASSSERSPSKR